MAENLLQELLRFAIEYTESRDARNIAAYNEMDEKRKNFITFVQEILSVDDMQKFVEAINILENPQTVLYEKINAFAIIKDHMENEQFAPHIAEVGGTAIIVPHLSHENTGLKKRALDSLTAMVHHNKECDYYLIRPNIMASIVENFWSRDNEVVESALRLASSLVPNNDHTLNQFIDANGITALSNIFNTAQRRSAYMACSLIALLSKKSDVLRDQLVTNLDPNRIVNHFEDASGFDSDLEDLLSALSELTRSNLWNPGNFVNVQIIEIVEELQSLCSVIPEMERLLDLVSIIIHNLTLR